MGRAAGVLALGGWACVGWPGPASADSQMHQSPLLDRGSAEACGERASGRSLAGAYA